MNAATWEDVEEALDSCHEHADEILLELRRLLREAVAATRMEDGTTLGELASA